VAHATLLGDKTEAMTSELYDRRNDDARVGEVERMGI